MKKIVFFAVSIAFFSGCSEEKQPVNELQENVAIEQDVVVTPTNLLTMEVSGMTCEMGCGGTIRKHLKETKAVDKVTFDFKAGRDKNTAQIAYDATKISKEEIAKIVGEISNKQYTVGATSVEEYVSPAEGSSTSSDSKKMSADIPLETTESSTFILPNIFDLIRISF